jgi:hypothetical protein
MMVTVTLELDETIARQATAAGLLTSDAIQGWLKNELRQTRAALLATARAEADARLRADFPEISDAVFARLMLDEDSPPRRLQRERAAAATRALLSQLDALDPPLSEAEIAAALADPS